jgi:hypothetical protein
MPVNIRQDVERFRVSFSIAFASAAALERLRCGQRSLACASSQLTSARLSNSSTIF